MPPSVPGQSATPENFVLKISKPGFDVRSATDSQLIFNSNQNVIKINTILTKTHIINNAGVIGVQYPHGLGFAPSFLCYSSSNNPADTIGTSSPVNYSCTGAPASNAHSVGYVYGVDSTYVYAAYQSDNVTNYTVTLKIYLFQESVT